MAILKCQDTRYHYELSCGHFDYSFLNAELEAGKRNYFQSCGYLAGSLGFFIHAQKNVSKKMSCVELA